MRHRKAGLKLGRTTSHREAMFRNMVTSIFKHDRIRTTEAKARELRRWVDHVITLAKSGDLHARRQALAIVREKDVVHKLFETAGERFGSIVGGYTRLVKVGRRSGDAAPMSIIELVGPGAAPGKKKKTKAAKETPAAAAPAAPVAAAPAPAEETPEPATQESASAQTQADTDTDTGADVQAASAEAAAEEADAPPVGEAEEPPPPEEKKTEA
jgi:large subunit ribosomal protein L17